MRPLSSSAAIRWITTNPVTKAPRQNEKYKNYARNVARHFPENLVLHDATLPTKYESSTSQTKKGNCIAV